MLGEISQARRTDPAQCYSPRGLEQSRPEAQPGGRRGVSVYLDRACLWKMKTSQGMVVMVVHPRACT